MFSQVPRALAELMGLFFRGLSETILQTDPSTFVTVWRIYQEGGETHL